jgi:DNA-binding response OmpR family regulator
MARLLIVAADHKVLSSLERTLQAQGHEVVAATTGEGAFVVAMAQPFDCLVLDVCLHGKVTVEVVRELRRAGQTLPALILTAGDTVEDRVVGCGADTDCLAKPFTLAELVARVRALLSRDRAGRETVLEAGDLSMDGAHRRVLLGGVEIALTRREFDLLEYLLRHKNTPVTRHMLGSHVWREPEATLTNVIDVYINALRRKLGRVGRRSLIQTVRGVGYELQDGRESCEGAPGAAASTDVAARGMARESRSRRSG